MRSETNFRLPVAGPCARLVLGTAQLGLAYGVANVTGLPDANTANGIVAAVWKHGVRFFDTAQAYGSSESALGQAFAELGAGREARVVTKVDLPPGRYEAKALQRSVEASLARLGVPALWGLLLHREEVLDEWSGGLGRDLARLRDHGLVGHVGASVYTPDRALQALAHEELDVVQVPANVFDRRMERAGVFQQARDRGKTVFVRSLFLQGLALMPPEGAARAVPRAAEAVSSFARFCAERQVDRRRFALDYVVQMAPEALLIIGAESLAQASENCNLFGRPSLSPEVTAAWTARWPEDVGELVDPRRWPPRPA